MTRSGLEQWKVEHPHANADPEAFEPIRASLVAVKLPAIAEACGVRNASASAWRAGRHVPPVTHWETLWQLAGPRVSVATVLPSVYRT